MKIKFLKQVSCVTLVLFSLSATFAKDKDDDKDHKKGPSKKSSKGSPGSKPSGGPSGGPSGKPSGGPSSGKPSGGSSSGKPSGGSSSGKPSGGPSGKPSGGPSGKPSGGSSGGPSGKPSGGPSGSGPGGSSRGGPSSGPQMTHRDGPRFLEPGRRPSVALEIRPPYRSFRRPGPAPMPSTVGVTGADVQHALAERGFYYGPIDGLIGPMSRRAIAAFQAEAGLAPTGEINASLLRALGL